MLSMWKTSLKELMVPRLLLARLNDFDLRQNDLLSGWIRAGSGNELIMKDSSTSSLIWQGFSTFSW